MPKGKTNQCTKAECPPPTAYQSAETQFLGCNENIQEDN